MGMLQINGHRIPTRREAAIFRAKSTLLKIRRAYQDAVNPEVKTFTKAQAKNDDPVIAESKTLLWTGTEPEDVLLNAGKIQNLRIAVAKVDGVEIAAGETFSFWKQIGRASRSRGFVRGREIREGCIIPTIGGGLCQLSNSLYDSALKANFEIIERHRHTQVVPGSLAEQGRDATVYWNYLDLRFRSAEAFRIEATLDSEHLTVRFRGRKPQVKPLHQIGRSSTSKGQVNSCTTCGMDDCFRSQKTAPVAGIHKTAYLVDEFSPEFDEYIQACRSRYDILVLPIDGRRFRKSNYAWSTKGFEKIAQSRSVTALRAYRSRQLSQQGADRQRNLLSMNEKLAESFARELKFDVLHVVVQQNLLPFLWRGGYLGGRTFDVLMTALPMADIQKRLDLAHSLHPESETLADFRADPALVNAETEALANARWIITAHTAIAAGFEDRAEVLEWKKPDVRTIEKRSLSKPRIVFPASTVGRKGCYELREALTELHAKLITLGPYIEGSDFWEGFDVESGDDDWMSHADLVVLPAFAENRPRRLLAAAAAGIPVIASRACGVDQISGIETVEAGDPRMLRDMIVKCLDRSPAAS